MSRAFEYILWCLWGPNWSLWGREHPPNMGTTGGHRLGSLPGLESGITRGKWRRDGLSGLQTEPVWLQGPPGSPKPSQPHPCLGATLGPQAAHSQGLGVAQMCPPQDILAERWEGVLLVMAKHLKHNWLALDVFDERSCHLHSDLEEKELVSH